MTRTRIGQRIRNAPLTRYVRREARDPEVRSAARDIAVLYGMHRGLKKLPVLNEKVRARFQQVRRPPISDADDAMHFMFGTAPHTSLRSRVAKSLKVGKRALRFKRRGFLTVGKAIRSGRNLGKSALKILSIVR